MSTAILLVTPVLVLLFGGYFLDKYLHSTPFWTIVGLIFGFVGGVMNVFRLLSVVQKRKK
jgi:F0F1-type ATP synthase assembly protein I